MIRGLGNLYKSVNCNFMLKVVIFTTIIIVVVMLSH